MMTIKIDTHVELPPIKRRAKPFTLEVYEALGQLPVDPKVSFFAEIPQALATALISNFKRHRHIPMIDVPAKKDWRFTTRKERNGTRIWRVA